MIKLEKNLEMDNAMSGLIGSMLEVNDYLSAVTGYMERYLSLKEERKLIEILKSFGIPYENLKYDINKLKENPYFRDVKLNHVDTETVYYERAVIKKRTLINMNFHRPLGKYLFHYHPIGYFDEDLELPALMEGSRVWMSPAVSEMESMKEGIVKGKGRCLALGLGLGMLPYLWLLKDQVESVTVVEYNKDVIDLFEKYIRPQFKTNKPLEIIKGNAYDYYKESFLREFDYVYVDFWENTSDGLEAYTRLMEKEVSLSHIDYWIEDSILQDIKHLTTMYLYNLYEGKSIADFICSMEGEMNIYAKKVNKYFKKSNELIRSEEQLLGIVHGKSILRDILAK